jgi:hypothetical protein
MHTHAHTGTHSHTQEHSSLLHGGGVWWHVRLNTAAAHKFEPSLSYLVGPCLKNKQKNGKVDFICILVLFVVS